MTDYSKIALPKSWENQPASRRALRLLLIDGAKTDAEIARKVGLNRMKIGRIRKWLMENFPKLRNDDNARLLWSTQRTSDSKRIWTRQESFKETGFFGKSQIGKADNNLDPKQPIDIDFSQAVFTQSPFYRPGYEKSEEGEFESYLDQEHYSSLRPELLRNPDLDVSDAFRNLGTERKAAGSRKDEECVFTYTPPHSILSSLDERIERIRGGRHADLILTHLPETHDPFKHWKELGRALQEDCLAREGFAIIIANQIQYANLSAAIVGRPKDLRDPQSEELFGEKISNDHYEFHEELWENGRHLLWTLVLPMKHRVLRIRKRNSKESSFHARWKAVAILGSEIRVRDRPSIHAALNELVSNDILDPISTTEEILLTYRKLIRALCPENGIVIDPIARKCETAMAVLLEKRRFIGFTKSSRQTVDLREKLINFRK